MGCKAGYPSKPCPFGFDGRVTRASCGACKNYEPPAWLKSICMLYDRDRIVCKLPRSSCASCPSRMERPPGRPPGEGETDWNDPASIRKYLQGWRAKNPRKVEAQRERLLKRHPDYFKRYRERNREELNRQARERYRKAKKDSDE